MRYLLIIDESGNPLIKTEYTKELENRLQEFLKEKQVEVQI